jgi:type II secretory pathway predicted ATPase ExeA
LFQRFQNFVVEAYAQGRRVLLIFDEAQNLTVDALEELRMLSNINADQAELLQLILVGQPQLRDLLSKPELVQFSQRISADFHLEALSELEVDEYVRHRLELSGARWRIFTRSACSLIHYATRGVPRLINVLCDLCLVYGFSLEAKVIEPPLVHEFLSGARKRGIYQQFTPLPEATPTQFAASGS